MLYSVDVLRTVGRGGGGARRLVGMVCPPVLGLRSSTSCVCCCHLRKRQRLLAALSASTGLSLLLLLFLQTSPSMLSSKDSQVPLKELPEKSHYVRDTIETRNVYEYVSRKAVLKPATYNDRQLTRLNDKHSKKNHEPPTVNVTDDHTASVVKQKLQLYPLKKSVIWKQTLEEPLRRSHGDDAFEVGKRRGIDSPTEVNPAKTSKNTTRGSSPHLAGPQGLVAPAEVDAESGGRPPRDGPHHPLLLVLDYSRPSYYPWRTTKDECANFATRFVVGGGTPVTALASFPGSGNTWLRYLVEAITGVFTGSVYHDEALAKKGFLGERDGYRKGTTLLQKTHSYPLLPQDTMTGKVFKFLLPRTPRKVVLLMRNPWESMVALRHYNAAGHTGFGSNSFFRGPKWADFTKERSAIWVKFNKVWLTLPNTTIHVIHYEHLQHRLEQETIRLMKFLGLPLDYGRLDCLIRYPEGRFRRPKYPKHLQGYRFPAKVEEILREGMATLNTILAEGDHPTLPTDLYSFKPIYEALEDSPAPLVAVPAGG